ncbi:hypothetical protein ACHHYP_09067 [Achlya hypogyna]|uniref:Uncharacterized protein n=1 Tax=Achlya hypogyna TaxID=1202772 RepID=A0A1V9ZJP8_ACHHY|nr:hypothetical protein ACHHYP_09067 [Achlya hypogyna]
MKAKSTSLPQERPRPRVCRAGDIRKSDIDLELLQAIALQGMHFSDDESDGVESDDDIDKLDAVFVPVQGWNKKRPSPTKKGVYTTSPSKPATTDDLGWTFVDKSPTFERVRAGKHAMSQSWSRA